jgi:hypothetical protein
VSHGGGFKLSASIQKPESHRKYIHSAPPEQAHDFYDCGVRIERLNPPAPLVFLLLRLCEKIHFTQRRKDKT